MPRFARLSVTLLMLAVVVGCGLGGALGPAASGPEMGASQRATAEPTEIERRFASTEEAAAVLTEYGQSHADEYGGLYVDQEAGGILVLLFTGNLEEHERAVNALVSDPAMVTVREVRYTEGELLAVMDSLTDRHREFQEAGIEMLSASLDTMENEIDFEAKSDDPGTEAYIEGLHPGMVDATIYPFPGPWSNVERGDGWRLLAAGEVGGGEAYTVRAATDAGAGEALWREIGLDGPMPPVDWLQEIVVSFSEGIGSSCPELRLDGVVIDDSAGLVYSVTSDPLAPRSCTADLVGAQAFVVALDRAALPRSPFTLQLNADALPCADCGFQSVIEVNVP